MKGNEEVLKVLKHLLADELTAINHAECLIQRIVLPEAI